MQFSSCPLSARRRGHFQPSSSLASSCLRTTSWGNADLRPTVFICWQDHSCSLCHNILELHWYYGDGKIVVLKGFFELWWIMFIFGPNVMQSFTIHMLLTLKCFYTVKFDLRLEYSCIYYTHRWVWGNQVLNLEA